MASIHSHVAGTSFGDERKLLYENERILQAHVFPGTLLRLRKVTIGALYFYVWVYVGNIFHNQFHMLETCIFNVDEYRREHHINSTIHIHTH